MSRQRILFFPDGRRLEVSDDYVPPPRRAPAIHGVKEPFRSMADGRFYDDMRTYERSLRTQGYEIAGNELKPFLNPDRVPMPPLKDDIEHAEAMVARGEAAQPELIDNVENLV